MPKNPFVRTLMGSQDVKGTKKRFKSSRQYFCHIFLKKHQENQLEKFDLSSI